MTTCVYDNPDTMARECYRDGQLVCHYTAALLLRKLSPWENQPVPGKYFFFGANIGPWKAGQLVGDRAAMNKVRVQP